MTKTVPETTSYALQIPQTHWRTVHMGVVACASFALYIYSMPWDFTLEDSGLFLMATHTLGISHPPGYPLYTLLGHAFTHGLPGSIPVNLHVMSALFAALTCSTLWWIVRSLTGRVSAGYLAGLGFAASKVFWSQSIIAEVYSLNTFFFFLLLALCLLFKERRTKVTAFVLGLVLGLSLSHHWILIVLGSPCLLLLYGWGGMKGWRKHVPLLATGVVLGLLPYVWMVWRSGQDPLIAFYGSIQSRKDFIFYVLRKGYSTVDKSQAWTSADQWNYYGFLGRQMAEQFTLVGVVFASVGFVLQWKRLPVVVASALSLAFVGSTLVLWSMLHFDYEPLWQLVISVYPLIPYGVMAIWMGVALSAFEDFAKDSFGKAGHYAAALLVIPLVAGTVNIHWPENNRRDYHWARDYAQVILDSLANNAVLFVMGDSDTGPIGYLHYVEGRRPDIDLYNSQSLVFRNRLTKPLAKAAQKQEAVTAFIQQCDRPVYSTANLQHGFPQTYFGLFYKIEKNNKVEGLKVAYSIPILDYLESELNAPSPTDPWTIEIQSNILASYAPVLFALQEAPHSDVVIRSRFHNLFQKMCMRYDASIMIADAMMNLGKVKESQALLETIALPQETSKSLSSTYYWLLAKLSLLQKQPEKALPHMVKSVAIYPIAERNQAVWNLLEYYAVHKERELFRELKHRVYPNEKAVPVKIRELDKHFDVDVK